MDRSSDRDSLSLTTRERSNGKIKSMHLNIENPQRVGRLGPHLLTINYRKAENALERLTAKKHVGADIEIISQSQVLVNRFDYVFSRPFWILKGDLTAAGAHRSVVG